METYDFMELYSSGRLKNQKAILTIGVFDGVHKGHQALLREVVALQKKYKDSKSYAITFSTNPKPGIPRNIDTLRIRSENIANYGINGLVIIDFSSDFSRISGVGFIEMLMHLFDPVAVVVGYDFRCGHPSDSATAQDLEVLFQNHGKKVEIKIMQAILTEGGEKISSTLVRRVIDNGQLGCIPKLTGQFYQIDLGYLLGEIKSAELVFCRDSIHQLLPPEGVYEAKLLLKNGLLLPVEVLIDERNLIIQKKADSVGNSESWSYAEDLQQNSIYLLEKQK